MGVIGKRRPAGDLQSRRIGSSKVGRQRFLTRLEAPVAREEPERTGGVGGIGRYMLHAPVVEGDSRFEALYIHETAEKV